MNTIYEISNQERLTNLMTKEEAYVKDFLDNTMIKGVVYPEPHLNSIDIKFENKGHVYYASNFYFPLKEDLTDINNWHILESKIVHGVTETYNAFTCDCGQKVSFKNQPDLIDFCQKLSHPNFITLLLSSLLMNDEGMKRMKNHIQRNRRIKEFQSSYFYLDKLENHQLWSVKEEFKRGIEVRHIEKEEGSFISIYFNLEHQPMNFVLKNVKYELLGAENEGTPFISSSESKVYHEKGSDDMSFCVHCLKDYVDENEEGTNCSVLTNLDIMGWISEVIALNDLGRKAVDFVINANVGDILKYEDILINDESEMKTKTYSIEEMLSAMKNVENTIASNGKVKRNDPCPCGSGEKYKKCCLN